MPVHHKITAFWCFSTPVSGAILRPFPGNSQDRHRDCRLHKPHIFAPLGHGRDLAIPSAYPNFRKFNYNNDREFFGGSVSISHATSGLKTPAA